MLVAAPGLLADARLRGRYSAPPTSSNLWLDIIQPPGITKASMKLPKEKSDCLILNLFLIPVRIGTDFMHRYRKLI